MIKLPGPVPKKILVLRVSMAIDQPASLGSRVTANCWLGKSWKPIRIIAETERPAAKKYWSFLAPDLILKAMIRLKGRVVIKKPTKLKSEPVGEKVFKVR